MNAEQSAFLKTVVPAAIASQAATGVPASVTIAQCALESGWLKSMPAGSNNPFGIKARHLSAPNTYVEAETPEYADGHIRHELQPFQKYQTLADAFVAHANLLAKAPRYRPAMAVRRDVEAFARQLQSCGYSTNRPPLASKPPFYADELLKLIRLYDLKQYDLPPKDPANAAEAAA